MNEKNAEQTQKSEYPLPLHSYERRSSLSGAPDAITHRVEDVTGAQLLEADGEERTLYSPDRIDPAGERIDWMSPETIDVHKLNSQARLTEVVHQAIDEREWQVNEGIAKLGRLKGLRKLLANSSLTRLLDYEQDLNDYKRKQVPEAAARQIADHLRKEHSDTLRDAALNEAQSNGIEIK